MTSCTPRPPTASAPSPPGITQGPSGPVPRARPGDSEELDSRIIIHARPSGRFPSHSVVEASSTSGFRQRSSRLPGPRGRGPTATAQQTSVRVLSAGSIVKVADRPAGVDRIRRNSSWCVPIQPPTPNSPARKCDRVLLEYPRFSADASTPTSSPNDRSRRRLPRPLPCRSSTSRSAGSDDSAIVVVVSGRNGTPLDANAGGRIELRGATNSRSPWPAGWRSRRSGK